MFNVGFVKYDKVEVYRRVVQVTPHPFCGNVTTLKQSITIKMSISTLYLIIDSNYFALLIIH